MTEQNNDWLGTGRERLDTVQRTAEQGGCPRWLAVATRWAMHLL